MEVREECKPRETHRTTPAEREHLPLEREADGESAGGGAAAEGLD